MSLECKILKSYGLSDAVPFGKHKGKKIKEVVSKNPQWIIWANENIPSFRVSHRAFKMAEDNYSEQMSESWDKAFEYQEWFWK